MEKNLINKKYIYKTKTIISYSYKKNDNIYKRIQTHIVSNFEKSLINKTKKNYNILLPPKTEDIQENPNTRSQ